MNTERLPLFPLRTVLFPGGWLPLHIFEERYRLMIGRCLEGDRRFGVCAIRVGEEVGEPAEPFRVGTEALITRVKPLPDGRIDLQVVGQRRFGVVELTQQQPYLVAEVTFLGEDSGDERSPTLAAELRAAIGSYLRLLDDEEDASFREQLARRRPDAVEWFPPLPGGSVVPLPEDPLALSYLAPQLLSIACPQQQALLQEMSTAARLEELLACLPTLEAELQRARHRRLARRHGNGTPPGDPTIH